MIFQNLKQVLCLNLWDWCFHPNYFYRKFQRLNSFNALFAVIFRASLVTHLIWKSKLSITYFLKVSWIILCSWFVLIIVCFYPPFKHIYVNFLQRVGQITMLENASSFKRKTNITPLSTGWLSDLPTKTSSVRYKLFACWLQK